jgi:hypothetical protein
MTKNGQTSLEGLALAFAMLLNLGIFAQRNNSFGSFGCNLVTAVAIICSDRRAATRFFCKVKTRTFKLYR